MGNDNQPGESPQTDQKIHKVDNHMKKTLTIIAVILLITIIPAAVYKYYTFAINREAQSHKEAVFEIESGQSVSQIAANLYLQDLINSEFLFKLYIAVNGLTSEIEAGIFNIPAGASVAELAEIFQHGTNEVKVTFLEGWRIEEIALEASESLDKIDYQKVINIAGESEGYFFPDTYFFDAGVTEEELVQTLTANFENKAGELLNNADLDSLGLTEQQVLNLASIVEREVYDEQDREIVAGILINRFRNGELLGADATTQYAAAPYRYCSRPAEPVQDYKQVCSFTLEEARAIEWWPDSLTQDELEYPDPFNTRRVSGLPPHPISNPGLSAIEAVLNYRDTNYNYYLTDDNGVTYYAQTLEEHNENIRRYLSQ